MSDDPRLDAVRMAVLRRPHGQDSAEAAVTALDTYDAEHRRVPDWMERVRITPAEAPMMVYRVRPKGNQ